MSLGSHASATSLPCRERVRFPRSQQPCPALGEAGASGASAHGGLPGEGIHRGPGRARGRWGTHRRLRLEVPPCARRAWQPPVARTLAAWDHDEGFGAARWLRRDRRRDREQAPHSRQPRSRPGHSGPQARFPEPPPSRCSPRLRVDVGQVGSARSVCRWGGRQWSVSTPHSQEGVWGDAG